MPRHPATGRSPLRMTCPVAVERHQKQARPPATCWFAGAGSSAQAITPRQRLFSDQAPSIRQGLVRRERRLRALRRPSVSRHPCHEPRQQGECQQHSDAVPHGPSSVSLGRRLSSRNSGPGVLGNFLFLEKTPNHLKRASENNCPGTILPGCRDDPLVSPHRKRDTGGPECLPPAPGASPPRGKHFSGIDFP